MKAKAYLKQISKLNKMIRNKQELVDYWKGIANGNTGQAEGERVKASGSQQKMADAVVRYADIEKEIADLQAEIDGIVKTIEQLPCDEYDVIHKHYIQGIIMKDIPSICNKSYSWVIKKHNDGLRGLEDILERSSNV